MTVRRYFGPIPKLSSIEEIICKLEEILRKMSEDQIKREQSLAKSSD